MAKKQASAQSTVRQIRRKTRKKYSAEDKIRIVIEGLRGDMSCTSSKVFGHKGLILYGDFRLVDWIIHPRFAGAAGDVKPGSVL
jgi:hypothetical protein